MLQLTDKTVSFFSRRRPPDELPAGGDLLGAAVLIFLVLLFTDIMGYTKVFPFTRSAR